MIKLIIFFK